MIKFDKIPDNHKITKKWMKNWEKNKTYKFDENSKKPIYSIDTPPPTVSGRMHIGHAFSYTQTDFIARYKRMMGYNVYYPFGTDDNGLATEKLIQKETGKSPKSMNRSEYIKLCLSTLKKLKKPFIQDWKNMGISCDFNYSFSSIDDHARKIAQKTFIELYNQKRAYRMESPVLWDIVFQSAVAQAELEGSERNTIFNEIEFQTESGYKFNIATTRPELLGACVAVMVNPDDKRFSKFIGQTVITPIYESNVPIIADKRVDIEKGTGAVMCCTFGDQTDIEWYKEHKLPLKMIINKSGKMNELSGKYNGLSIIDARKEIIDDLKKLNLIKSQTKKKQIVQLGERSKQPIEIINSKQWYIKYLDKKNKFHSLNKKLNWYPSFMSNRLKNWIDGIGWDWSIARQRNFGVPIPVWYTESGEVVLPEMNELPIDPIKQRPKRISKSVKLIPEKDVFDTWFTSSSTPEIYRELISKKNLKDKITIFDLRPMAHDIINNWLFYTMSKNNLLYNILAWKNATISGHVQDPNGKKMSKSIGNIIEPQKMIDKFNVDALRYFAGSKKLGDDAPFQEKELKTGVKLINKLWNTCKFIYSENKIPSSNKNLEIEDKWIMSRFEIAYKNYIKNFDNYESKFALESIEQFFYKDFCDFYLEMIKGRIYSNDKSKISALYTANLIFQNSLKLFAPFIPFITEELYSKINKSESIHLENISKLKKNSYTEELKLGELAKEYITKIRKLKQDNQIKLGEYIESITISSHKTKDIQKISEILCRTARVNEIKLTTGKENLFLN